MDWPSDWHEQLNLTMKCLDIVKQFGTSEMKSYVEEETSAIMQFFYYIDFDYYKAEDDYYGNEVYELIKDYENNFENITLYEYIQMLAEIAFIESSPAPIKYILSKHNLLINQLRLPLVPLSSPFKQLIDNIIE